MCGIAGIWQPGGLNRGSDTALELMSSAIAHRGPDDSGAWSDPDPGIALGFRRLAIIDTSPKGHQPMISASGRYVIVFNGEIYNFLELRTELESRGEKFLGHSDTEVVLAGIECWGLTAALTRFAGMFAIALWDRQDRALSLCRDRLGEKPLYFSCNRNVVLFASELKALRAHPEWSGTIDPSAVALFMRYNYIPAPRSIFSNTSKVIPGTVVTFAGNTGTAPTVTTYWSPAAMAEAASIEPFQADPYQLTESLDQLLRDTVRREMVADVPLGAFLSGGVDSSLLVALMQAQSDKPVRTFTIGFHEHGFDEAPHAAQVANHLGAEHTELYVTPAAALDVVPRLPHIYDEPFADSSQIPTYLVAKLARRKVTVALSGEGADELFGGYNRYFWGRRLWSRLNATPRPLRRAMGGALNVVSADSWNALGATIQPLLPRKYHVVNPGHKLQRASSLIASEGMEDLYHRAMMRNQHSERITTARVPTTILNSPQQWPCMDGVRRMMYFDLVTELPDDILAKVDRATMAVSLESRAPYLDHRVAEFAWRVPTEFKLRDGRGKWLLRQVLDRYVPRQLIERPKMGFGVPIAAWLRGPLREWASDLLADHRLQQDGFFVPSAVEALWRGHQTGKQDNAHTLWALLMFQAWRAVD